MFRCDHCHTEYGGIRGIAAERCPRCTSKDGVAAQQRPALLAMAPAAPWRPPQLAASSWSLSSR